MKLTLLFTLLLCSLLNAKSSDFSVIVKQPFDAALFDVTEDYDRTLTGVGFSKHFKQNSNTSKTYTNAFDYLASISAKYGTQMHIIKVDNSASIIFSKVAKLTRFNEAVAVVKTPTNGYFIGGYTLDGDLLIAKLDANANVIYSQIFGTKNYDRLHDLILMSDGGILAVGSSITSRSKQDALFETGLGNNDIFITRFSKDARKLWSKKYGTQYDDEGIDAVEAQDGSIIVLSKTSYDKHRDVTFMRLDENGNKIWLKHYRGEQLTIPKKIIRLRDNNFVISLVQYNDMQKEHIRLIKFDLYKNVLIDKHIFTTYPSGLNDIQEFSDGTFIGVGYVKDIDNTDGLAMILDANLLMLNQEHYGEENYDEFKAVKILHNSQVGVAGIHTDNDSQESNMWILKLNRDASMAQISTKTSSFYERFCAIFKDEIDAKKIIVREDLSIEFLDKSLYFKVGEYKLTDEQKLFLDSFSQKLLPFLKTNREFIETLEVNGHTSSEWAKDSFSQRYLKNEKLSMERSFSTLSYIFKNQNQTTQKWLIKVLRGSGFSYRKNIKFNEIEDKKRSRRVTFKVFLK
jgi:outer membrane protein OmpA-like peptidoglycan-associated protein